MTRLEIFDELFYITCKSLNSGVENVIECAKHNMQVYINYLNTKGLAHSKILVEFASDKMKK